ncbi:MAG: hypothetical protein Q7S40_34780 [Opitutaceae bacterium]|nr:hypothetical protein [Opitutaceae bacterium]
MRFLQAVFPVVIAATLVVAQSSARDGVLEISTSAREAGRTVRPLTAAGYTVAGFEIKGRWNGGVSLPLRPGDLWTPDKQSEVFAAIQQAFDSEQSHAYLLSQASVASVLYIHVDEQKDEAARTVKLTFRPLRVRLFLAKIGDNMLPIPRSPAPTRYEAVPAPLLVLNPVFGTTYDRAFGTALTAGVQADLLALPDTLSGRGPQHERPGHLDLRFTGSKSLDNFHRANAGLGYAYRRLGESLQELSLGADYNDAKEPLAGQEHVTKTGGINGGIALRLAPHTRLTFNAGYRDAKDRLKDDVFRWQTSTKIQSNRLLVESLLPRPLGGFVRAAVWEDNGSTDKGIGSHQRLVGRAGYAREFALSPNQTIGLELIGGGGRLWGRAPASRRFFGGGSSSQFLYDGAADPGLLNLPAGPLIRSFGQGEAVGHGPAAAGGGDGFWHLNLNLTLPIRGLSFPLIPPEEEVRNRLRNGINVSGRSFLISALKKEGKSREEAVAEADRTLGEIRPATEFIIDQANLYSLKPLLMFDAGQLTGTAGAPTWLATGAGVQFTIVTAKFELGYMRTVSGPTTGKRGNLLFRLVFQNLF